MTTITDVNTVAVTDATPVELQWWPPRGTDSPALTVDVLVGDDLDAVATVNEWAEADAHVDVVFDGHPAVLEDATIREVDTTRGRVTVRALTDDRTVHDLLDRIDGLTVNPTFPAGITVKELRSA